MAEFFIVFGQAVGNKSSPKNNQEKHGNTEYEANPEECKFIKLSTGSAGAAGIKEAQQTIRHFFGGDVTQTPIVVTKAEWEKATETSTTNYFVVFTQQNMGRRFTLPEGGEKFESVEILEDPFEANFIKIKAESRTEAKEAIMRHFGGDITTTVRAIPEAQWKSS